MANRSDRLQGLSNDDGPNKIFVGNLPLDIVPSELDNLFSKFNVREVKMIFDRESDKFKGFAYIDFATKEDLNKALEFNGVNYGGRPLRVDIASARGGGKREGGGGRRGDSNAGQKWGGNRGFQAGRGTSGQSYSNTQRPNRSNFEDERRNMDIPHSSDSGRPRLNLQPRTTDPEKLKELQLLEEEEMKKRQRRIFGEE